MQHIPFDQRPHIQETLRLLSTYKYLKTAQLKSLLTDISDENFRFLLRRLEKNGRLYLNKETMMIQHSQDTVSIPGQIEALWVLIDFYPEVSYHSAGNFPIVLHFFTSEKAYEVIFIPPGKEMVMNHALSVISSASRLIIIKDIDQIRSICIPDISAFCLVSADGQVEYYKRSEEPSYG